MSKEYVEQREGGYYLRGTRVSLDSIVHGFREGQSPETILEDFDTLTLEQVYGAITFYLSAQPEIDVYMVRQAKRWRELKQNTPPLPLELRERLENARKQQPVGRTD